MTFSMKKISEIIGRETETDDNSRFENNINN